jgi:hypothetical protein
VSRECVTIPDESRKMTEETHQRTIEQEHGPSEGSSPEGPTSRMQGEPTGEPQAAENRENDPPA